MIELYKIITNKYDPEITAGMISFSNTTHTRGNNYKIQKNRAKLRMRNNTFFYRTTDHWNKLPNNVVLAPSIKAFESRRDKFWNHHPIRYNYKANTNDLYPRMPLQSFTYTDENEELALEAIQA